MQRLRSGRLHVEELGCGNYGCVLPTDQPEVVVKITVDKSEARFVALTLDVPRLQSPGLTAYYAIERLPGSRSLQWDQSPRKIYALWRAAAHDVGRVELDLFRRTIPKTLKREIDDFIVRSNRFRDWASELQDIDLSSDGYMYDLIPAALLRKGADLVSVDDALLVQVQAVPEQPSLTEHIDNTWRIRAASLIAACRAEATLMAAYAPEAGGLVGQTLLSLMDEDIVLADVHAGNLGRLKDGRHGKLVIVDPGHAVLLRKKLAMRAEDALRETNRSRMDNPAAQASIVSLAAYQRS